MNANQIIANENASQFDHLFFDFIGKATGLRDLSGIILRHACLAKAYDEEGRIGTSKLNDFVNQFGDVRLGNIQAITDYILWAFTPGEIVMDKEGKEPLLEVEKSCLRWDSKNSRFTPASDKVKSVDEEGKEVTNKVTRKITPMDVKRRTSAYNWWTFNAAKPKNPYKGKFATALKNDLKAIKDEEWLPSENEMSFLLKVEALAKEMGIALEKVKA
jgi:hypothetical protein